MKKNKRFPIYFCDDDWYMIWMCCLYASGITETIDQHRNIDRIMDRISAKRSEFFFREEERRNK